MIKVTRSEAPPRLLAGDIRKELSRIERERGAYLRPLWSSAEVVDTLRSDFHNKCAFCESEFSDGRTHRVMHFRPTRNTLGDGGKLRANHYEWLAYEWSNLFSACAFCMSNRGTRFPVAGPRAQYGDRGEVLLDEEPLLIDPCVLDPAALLVQHSNGRLVSSDQRGLTTINAFDLNRPHLVNRRTEAVRELRAAWDERLDGDFNATEMTDWLSEQTSPRRSFCGQRRQILKLWASRVGGEVEAIVSRIAPVAEASPWSVADVDAAEESYDQQARERETYSLRSPHAAKPSEGKLARGLRSAAAAVGNLLSDFRIDGYFERSYTITKVELENIRSFESINFTIPRADDLRAPWTMFLGENATGKSTILQAIAACLAGSEQVNSLDLRPNDFLRAQKTEGSIRVHLSGRSTPLEVTLRRDQRRFEFKDPEPKVLVLGYGATRLLPRDRRKSTQTGTEYARVDNLFDPFTPTIDAGRWLLRQSLVNFELIGAAIELALDLPDDASFIRDEEAETVSLKAFGSTVPLRQLSDGYQSIIGTVVDIISVLLNRWESIDVAEGIVLIDELGSHLHPQWKTRIVHGLRGALPRVQFLVSTHDPLCVHGVGAREIVILERDATGTITATNELHSIDEMTIDQVLRTRLFKLPTTRGLTAVENYERAEELLGRRANDQITLAESDELSILLDRLGGPIYIESSRVDEPASAEIENWVSSSNPAIANLLNLMEEEE